MTKASRCEVCGDVGQITKEDIEPTWLRRALIAHAEARLGKIDHPEGRTHQLPARHVIRICRGCNASLRRLVEEPASKVLPGYIGGTATSVTRDEAQAIASWAAKVMLLSTLNSMRPRQWGYDECAAALRPIRTRGKPPPGLHVRVASTCVGHADEVAEDLLPPKMPRFEFYSLSVLGGLIYEVFHLPNGQRPAYQTWADDHRSVFVRIWPPAIRDVEIPSAGASEKQIAKMRATILENRDPVARLAPPVLRKVEWSEFRQTR